MGLQAKAIVVIGGGPTVDELLGGLKRYTARLTALVSTFGGGRPEGSDGARLRSPADAHSSLLALGADPVTTQIMQRLFAYRVEAAAEPGGYTFGNLLVSALTDIMGTADLALEAAARVLNVHGLVLPLTMHPGPLVAELLDGREVLVGDPEELIAAAAGTGVSGVRLGQPAAALATALRIIDEADIIVLGPTDLYFDMLGPLQLAGLKHAITSSTAVKIFVCNLVTQAHTTAGWPASRFIRAMLDAVDGPGNLDYVIISSTPVPPPDVLRLARDGRAPVTLDLEESLSLGLDVIARSVSDATGTHYDVEKLARTILFLGGAPARRSRAGGAPMPHNRPLLTPRVLARGVAADA
ncbi:MAG TPA: 2-phospho-L-lactate transferase CofD family protein [Chloroflexia bacterium]|nr:2-phospho-L-lactate transferase CofD family protein [Chloroflexia bacterium]